MGCYSKGKQVFLKTDGPEWSQYHPFGIFEQKAPGVNQACEGVFIKGNGGFYKSMQANPISIH